MKNIDLKKIAIISGAFILLAVVIISGLHILESTVFNNEVVPEEPESSKTVESEGTEYYPRQDITTVLFMGIDAAGPVEQSEFFVNEGRADVVSLIIFDEKDEKADVITLNRDSMVEMPVLGFGGKHTGTTYGHLALSHTYGTGLEDSCENVKWTVSNLLGGIEIDYYISVKMDAIPVINDAFGGVTVNVKDDFSAVDPDITMGEYTLFGEEALTFIRARKELGDQLNVSRMERQKEYVKGFLEAFNAKTETDELFVFELYDSVDEYIVTDCSGETLANIADRYQDYELREIFSPKGENILSDGHYEFYIDEKDLYETVLRLLYSPK